MEQIYPHALDIRHQSWAVQDTLVYQAIGEISNNKVSSIKTKYLKNECVRILSGVLAKNKTVVELKIRFDERNDPDPPLKYLISCLSINNTLSIINLRCCKLGGDSFKNLCKVLRGNNTVTHLCLSHDCLACKDAKALGKCLQINKSIINLNIGHNFIKTSGMKHLFKRLKYNETLKRIDIRDNSIWTEIFDVVNNTLLKNKTLGLVRTRLYTQDGIMTESERLMVTMLKQNVEEGDKLKNRTKTITLLLLCHFYYDDSPLSRYNLPSGPFFTILKMAGLYKRGYGIGPLDEKESPVFMRTIMDEKESSAFMRAMKKFKAE